MAVKSTFFFFFGCLNKAKKTSIKEGRKERRKERWEEGRGEVGEEGREENFGGDLLRKYFSVFHGKPR